MARDPIARPIFFTSDLHFFHKRICEFTGRPWNNVEEMHEGLIERWNNVVALTDEIFIVGDFSLASNKRTATVLERLNGTKYLIRGNHDRHEGLFEWEKDLYTLKVKDPDAPKGVQKIVLCHFPILVWDSRHYGAWHLHGHSHGNLADDPNALRLDVGVDVWGFSPVSYERIREAMRCKPCWPISKPLDHHGHEPRGDQDGRSVPDDS